MASQRTQANYQVTQPAQANQPQHVGLTAVGMGGGVKMVAGYALQQRLGSGSFATVYKGVKVLEAQGRTDTVAVKAISRTSEKLTKKVLENLETEINILRTYRHPNIVCLHEVQKTERHFYLLLEYCAGGDLQGLIRTRRSGRLTERLSRRLMRDLTAGLKFLWGQEFIHRDIKPQNLLLTGPLPLDELHDPSKIEADEEARQAENFPSSRFALKIADFGFARHLQTASLAETLCGSPLYMAPEILQHHRYDAKADLWSVGTVLFEMISGRPPFNGENHIDLLRNIQRKAVRLPPDVRISKECVNLLRLLLNRNPLSRAGFKEFFKASEAFVALGCEGKALTDQAQSSIEKPCLDLGPISEAGETSAHGAASLETVATAAPRELAVPAIENKLPLTSARHGVATDSPRFIPQLGSGKDSERNTPSSSPPGSVAPENAEQPQNRCEQQPVKMVSPQLVPSISPSAISQTQGNPHQGQPHQLVSATRRNSHFTPLEPSPPGAAASNRAMPPPPLHLGGVGGVAYLPSQAQAGQIRAQSNQAQQGYSQGRLVVPYHLAQRDHQYQTQHMQQRPESSHGSDDGGFVMVEHSGSLVPAPTATQCNNLERHQLPNQTIAHTGNQVYPNNMLYSRSSRQPLQPQTSPVASKLPASPKYYKPVVAGRRGSGFSKLTRGMLSTSPGTGGMLVGMMGKLTGGANNTGVVSSSPQPPANRFDTIGDPRPGGPSNLDLAMKMLAAAEDVGRRAVAVAHLGDTRAFLAMRMKLTNEGSSLLSSSPMEGVVEEEEDESRSSGLPGSDDTSSSSTRMAGRMRAVSADRSMDRQMANEEEEDDDEMPFAISDQESDPHFSLPQVPVKPLVSTISMSSSTTSSKPRGRASPAVILAHFQEALSCYLKALSMIKGAVGATQRVLDEFGGNIPPQCSHVDALETLKKRGELSHDWLSGQFAGVLERADAANSEITKSHSTLTQEQKEVEDAMQATIAAGNVTVPSVEELVYNHSLACGKDGAVKQLLGQHDAARSCYRSAGLLAETLLMEPRMGAEDRKVLEEYVHGFAERITELDSTMMQQSRYSSGTSSGNHESAKKNSGIVGLVAPTKPFLT